MVELKDHQWWRQVRDEVEPCLDKEAVEEATLGAAFI